MKRISEYCNGHEKGRKFDGAVILLFQRGVAFIVMYPYTTRDGKLVVCEAIQYAKRFDSEKYYTFVVSSYG